MSPPRFATPLLLGLLACAVLAPPSLAEDSMADPLAVSETARLGRILRMPVARPVARIAGAAGVARSPLPLPPPAPRARDLGLRLVLEEHYLARGFRSARACEADADPARCEAFLVDEVGTPDDAGWVPVRLEVGAVLGEEGLVTESLRVHPASGEIRRVPAEG